MIKDQSKIDANSRHCRSAPGIRAHFRAKPFLASAAMGFFQIENTIFSQVKAQLFVDGILRIPAG
jgi:hypothetical protein